ncbi:MAG: hypothetical protein MIO90_02050 [Methanomassiliicoccales archaeon]|nr:hypothetical protein [Methanomassiliicoccales archaeon]
MTSYEDYRSVIDASNLELQAIAEYLQDREGAVSPTTVLIGGWAVHAYNPWYGSIDIDLITNSRTKQSLKEHLVSARGFDRYRTSDDTKRIEKITVDGKPIIIDFGTRERPDPFEGRDSTIQYDILDGRTELKPVGRGLSIPVPKRELLLFFKLKAAWDRNFRIVNDTSYDLEWEKGKLRKDHADILALLDPKAGGQDVDLFALGEYLSQYPFLTGCLKQTADDADAISWYGRMDRKEVETAIRTILRSI